VREGERERERERGRKRKADTLQILYYIDSKAFGNGTFGTHTHTLIHLSFQAHWHNIYHFRNMLPILPCQPAQSRWDLIARIAVVTCLIPKTQKVTSFFE